MEQKQTPVKAEKEHDKGSEGGEGENWIKQDRGMENRNLNKSRNER